MKLFSRFFNDSDSGFLRSAKKTVNQINQLEADFEQLSSGGLKAKTSEFKERVKNGETLDGLLPEAFAAVREAAKRTLGQRHYDEQLIGGIALYDGKVAEMKTGEGKTLASTAAIYLNALLEKGVHVITVNDYLAQRDTVWMGQIYDALGLTVGSLGHQASYIYDQQYTNKDQENLDEVRDEVGGFKVVHEFLRPVTRTEAYRADITYGTNNEFGFDYLRDNLAKRSEDIVQRSDEEGGWHYVIVDEVDSILIDEARTPLIISSPDEESGKLYQKFSRIAPQLKRDADFTVDEKFRAVSLTQEGMNKVEKILGVDNLYEEGGIRLVHHLEQALKAHFLFERDRDYVVKDDQVIIVDQFTGRLMPGRRYSEGLHQAIEAKEGVAIQRESRTVATITFQNYFRKYSKISGMTGTAKSSQEEFFKVYGLEVVVVPTHRPLARKDLADQVYQTEHAKFEAVVKEIEQMHKNGQPVLVGTISIEKNEFVSQLLKARGIPHQMLNAKNHEKEAAIIAQAGKKGAVTVATNMAGRGVDIVLGGNPSSPQEAQEVRESGGLAVIGTERHEARRIDDQLRGRAGRQGDPGASQFFVSLEDDLMRIFGGDKVKGIMERLNIPQDQPIESGIVAKSIESAQKRIEGHHFDARKHVLDYDEVLNKQRERVYAMRRSFLEDKLGERVRETIIGFLESQASLITHESAAEQGYVNTEILIEQARKIIPPEHLKEVELKKEISSVGTDPEQVTQVIAEFLRKTYLARQETVGEDNFRALEKVVLLATIDELWRDNLDEMQYLRTAIGLRAYGQRDPLVEYKAEAHRMFQNLLLQLESKTIEIMFRVNVLAIPKAEPGLQFSGPAKQMEGNANNAQKTSGSVRSTRKIGRNEIVKITDGNQTKELKYKKALPLLESGEWQLIT